MAGCFQLGNIEDEPLRVNVPPIIDMRSVDPSPDSAVTFYMHGTDATFSIPRIIDANGMDEEDLHGLWWIENPATTSTVYPPIYIIDRIEDPAEGLPCSGCYWAASITVPSSSFSSEGCYQLTAAISDSEVEPCQGGEVGSLCTETPTIIAYVTWWVWVTEDGSDLPTVDECADMGSPVNPP